MEKDQVLDLATEFRRLKRKLDRQENEINHLKRNRKHYKSRSRSRSSKRNNSKRNRHHHFHRSHRSLSKSLSRNKPINNPFIDVDPVLSSFLSKNSNRNRIFQKSDTTPVVSSVINPPALPTIDPLVDLTNLSAIVPSTVNAQTISTVDSSAVVPPTNAISVENSAVLPPTIATTVENSVKIDEPILVPEILEAIGMRLDLDNRRMPAIHNDIIVRWKDILKKGLPEDERKNLFKKYLTPENGIFFEPPKLNLEIKASISHPIIKRDNEIVDMQRKVSVCLSSLGFMLSNLLKGITLDSLSLISNLSDLGRILIDLQRDETLTRRLIVSSILNSSLKETLNATTADEWLFGNDLSDTLKLAKSLERSSQDFKPQVKSNSNFTPKSSNNLKGPAVILTIDSYNLYQSDGRYSF